MFASTSEGNSKPHVLNQGNAAQPANQKLRRRAKARTSSARTHARRLGKQKVPWYEVKTLTRGARNKQASHRFCQESDTADAGEASERAGLKGQRSFDACDFSWQGTDNGVRQTAGTVVRGEHKERRR